MKYSDEIIEACKAAFQRGVDDLSKTQGDTIALMLDAYTSHLASAPVEGVMSESELDELLGNFAVEHGSYNFRRARELEDKISEGFSTLRRRLAEAESELQQRAEWGAKQVLDIRNAEIKIEALEAENAALGAALKMDGEVKYTVIPNTDLQRLVEAERKLAEFDSLVNKASMYVTGPLPINFPNPTSEQIRMLAEDEMRQEYPPVAAGAMSREELVDVVGKLPYSNWPVTQPRIDALLAHDAALRNRLSDQQTANSIMQGRIESYQQSLAEAEKERDHWKANHDNQVKLKQIYMDRPDLPFDRTDAHRQLQELQKKLAESPPVTAGDDRELIERLAVVWYDDPDMSGRSTIARILSELRRLGWGPKAELL